MFEPVYREKELIQVFTFNYYTTYIYNNFFIIKFCSPRKFERDATNNWNNYTHTIRIIIIAHLLLFVFFLLYVNCSKRSKSRGEQLCRERKFSARDGVLENGDILRGKGGHQDSYTLGPKRTRNDC